MGTSKPSKNNQVTHFSAIWLVKIDVICRLGLSRPRVVQSPNHAEVHKLTDDEPTYRHRFSFVKRVCSVHQWFLKNPKWQALYERSPGDNTGDNTGKCKGLLLGKRWPWWQVWQRPRRGRGTITFLTQTPLILCTPGQSALTIRPSQLRCITPLFARRFSKKRDLSFCTSHPKVNVVALNVGTVGHNSPTSPLEAYIGENFASTYKLKHCLMLNKLVADTNTNGLITTEFDPFRPMDNMALSTAAQKIRDIPNAGGNSVVSEVLSFEFFKCCFDADLVKVREFSLYPCLSLTEITRQYITWRKFQSFSQNEVKTFCYNIQIISCIGNFFPSWYSLRWQIKKLQYVHIFGAIISRHLNFPCIVFYSCWNAVIMYIFTTYMDISSVGNKLAIFYKLWYIGYCTCTVGKKKESCHINFEYQANQLTANWRHMLNYQWLSLISICTQGPNIRSDWILRDQVSN